MLGWPFFASVIHRVDQWLGNLFYRGQQINTLMTMTYAELKYWNDWHEIILKEDKGE
jgi:hypothetical protein